MRITTERRADHTIDTCIDEDGRPVFTFIVLPYEDETIATLSLNGGCISRDHARKLADALYDRLRCFADTGE